MLPVRTNLANLQLNVPVVSVNKETAENFNHLKTIGVEEVIPFTPKVEFEKAVEECEKALDLAESGAVRKSNNKKTKLNNSNTDPFLEELHKLIESWAPQSLDWEGDRRPILYDWECREEIRKLMIKHGL